MSSDGRRTVASEFSRLVAELASTLNDSQRTEMCFPESDPERLRWFYTPTNHGGLPLSEMASSQHRLVHRLLAAALSAAGHTTVATVMGLENVLDRVEGFGVSYGRERGRDPLLYWLSVFGDWESGNWSWRFGGHHVSLHFSVREGQVASATPLFLGADPAESALLGPHALRPLGGAEDLARDLLLSLDVESRAQAIATPRAPVDLMGGNRTRLGEGDVVVPLNEIWRGRFTDGTDEFLAEVHDRATVKAGWTVQDESTLALSRAPKGIAVSRMGKSQADLLRRLLAVYVDRISPALAEGQWALVERSFDELHFVWAGGLQPGEPHYYRVQGGGLLVEYDNTQRDVNHVHTVWRDLTMDFGGDPLARHYVDEH
jgi:hypothetical protein